MRSLIIQIARPLWRILNQIPLRARFRLITFLHFITFEATEAASTYTLFGSYSFMTNQIISAAHAKRSQRANEENNRVPLPATAHLDFLETSGTRAILQNSSAMFQSRFTRGVFTRGSRHGLTEIDSLDRVKSSSRKPRRLLFRHRRLSSARLHRF